MKVSPDCRSCVHVEVCKGVIEMSELKERTIALTKKFNSEVAITCPRWFTVTVECEYRKEGADVQEDREGAQR